MNKFRATGYRGPKLTATQAAGFANVLISAPAAGNQIVIYDVLIAGSDGTQVIRDGASGSVKMYLADGHTGFMSPFPMGDGKAVKPEKSGDSNATFAVTVVYSIEKVVD